MSGTFGESIISSIHDMSQINAIFIFCGDKSRHEKWAKNWSKIKGVLTEINDLRKAIKQTISECDQKSMSISFVETSESASNQNLNQLDPSFMYTQILKEIILQIDYNNQHIEDFVNYCREVFIGNVRELKICDKFEQEYHQRTPIWWYTYDCFLYSMVNRALRTMDVDVIIKMGFFIRDLCRQIERLHSEQFNADVNSQSFTVYRGQGLSEVDFYQLMKTKGGLLAFNNFMSTVKNQDISIAYAKSSQTKLNLIGVLFVMTIDPSISLTSFACTRDVSYYPKEDEVLFSMHSIFSIGDIKQIDNNNRLWQVDLTLTNDYDPKLKILIECIGNEMQGPSGWHRLGKILLELGQFNKAEEVYNVLLSQTINIYEKSILYDQLGMAKNGQGEYEEAIRFYEKALEIRRKALPLNHPDLAESYNNIGLVYNNMGEYSKALSFDEKALEIRQKTLPPNHPDLAESYNNIGSVHNNIKKYSKALSYHEKALEIRQKTLPPNHPKLAETYYNIGLVYENMGDHSKALSFCKQAVEIGQNSLLSNHPNLRQWQKTLKII
jgi:tetratricopeptide (TPR) repeat protein